MIDKELIRTMLSVPVPAKNVEQRKIASAVYNAIVVAHTLSGSDKNIQENSFMSVNTNIASLLADDIQRGMSWLRIEEIVFCFKLGVQGELGEYYGLNYKTYYVWLKSYYNSSERNEIKKTLIYEAEQNRKLKMLAKNCEKTPAEIDFIMRKAVNTAYKSYLENRNAYPGKIGKNLSVMDWGNAKSDFLDRKGKKEPSQSLEDYFKQCAGYGLTVIFAV